MKNEEIDDVLKKAAQKQQVSSIPTVLERIDDLDQAVRCVHGAIAAESVANGYGGLVFVVCAGLLHLAVRRGNGLLRRVAKG